MEAAATWTVHTEVFDGPLDLLLYLVKRDGVDLRRVSAAAITDSYLAFLDQMRSLNLSIAADYLVMAATLCHLKSLELLPRPPTLVEEGDQEDPRETLARRIEEYGRFRDAAEALDGLPRVDREVFVREPAPIDGLDQPLIPGVDAFGLLDTYYRLLTRADAPTPTYQVGTAGLSITACCRTVLDALGGVGGRGDLTTILRSLATRAERVLTFLAVLEMGRLQWIEIQQEEHLGPVALVSKVGDDVDLDLLESRLEETG